MVSKNRMWGAGPFDVPAFAVMRASNSCICSFRALTLSISLMLSGSCGSKRSLTASISSVSEISSSTCDMVFCGNRVLGPEVCVREELGWKKIFSRAHSLILVKSWASLC